MTQPDAGVLAQLLDEARRASRSDRIELRDPIARHGASAVDALAEWLADPDLCRFAVRVVGRVADFGDREAAIDALQAAREETTDAQRADIDGELHRLGIRPATSRSRPKLQRGTPTLTPAGWMMRTNRAAGSWLWSEVQQGRLRQGWGYQPKQDLNLLRHRRERGESLDPDDDLTWPNRRMLPDEPDGIQPGDYILTPHLPRERRWSVVRVTGPYRYEVDRERNDYGHILPVEVIQADIDPDDVHVDEPLREAVRYPARLMRMSDGQTAALHRLIGI